MSTFEFVWQFAFENSDINKSGERPVALRTGRKVTEAANEMTDFFKPCLVGRHRRVCVNSLVRLRGLWHPGFNNNVCYP